MDDFELEYRFFLAEKKRAWEDGWRCGYEIGRRDYFSAREEDWAEMFRINPWWLDALQRSSAAEMEERRYGPLPEGWTDPESEEHPGEARRRARASWCG